jgi:hypothetical protein
MLTSKTRRQLFSVFIVILFLLIFIIYYSCLISAYKINPFYPSKNKIVYQIDMIYPPPTSNGLMKDTLIEAKFCVETNETISEGVNMTITNATVYLNKEYVNKYFNDTVWLVELSFEHAQPTREIVFASGDPNSTSQYRISKRGAIAIPYQHNNSSNTSNDPDQWTTYHTYIRPIGLLLGASNSSYDPFTGFIQIKSFLNCTFYFPMAGDYSPSILILCRNNSLYRYTANDVKLHVPSQIELQTQALNQIGGFIAHILLAFASIDLVSLLYNWCKNAKED